MECSEKGGLGGGGGGGGVLGGGGGGGGKQARDFGKGEVNIEFLLRTSFCHVPY